MTTNINDLTLDDAQAVLEMAAESVGSDALFAAAEGLTDPTTEVARALVEADVLVGLGETFPSESDGFAITPGLAVTASENDEDHQVFCVPWVYECIHGGSIGDLGNELFALNSTGAPVLLEGVTTVRFDQAAGTVYLRRYIDWNLVLAQIGVSVAFRGAPVFERGGSADRSNARNFVQNGSLGLS